GQIQGPENGKAADEKAYKLAVQWLKDNAAIHWPRAVSPESPYGLDPKVIYDPDPSAPGDVLTRQYVRANCAPSDLYVQAPTGSLYTRMDADESGVDNLFLTGDWTHNGINSGCAESAARSGYRCALTIFGRKPPLPD
ncbi:MAG: FAD-dependent oxidoreductase, partial [Alphaproteobacteria bacterium]|nr:FAD-dependent oxidoreductase [Alphaproteobacteria bacterium]